jgi:hypothetical protein
MTPELITLIQGDQKVSVHLTITVHHQVQRDFLINLYINLKFWNILNVQNKGLKVLANYIQVTFSSHWSRLAKYLHPWTNTSLPVNRKSERLDFWFMIHRTMFIPLPYFVTSHKQHLHHAAKYDESHIRKLNSVYQMYADDKISCVGKTRSILSSTVLFQLQIVGFHRLSLFALTNIR